MLRDMLLYFGCHRGGRRDLILAVKRRFDRRLSLIDSLSLSL
jgi:hypothetical protein